MARKDSTARICRMVGKLVKDEKEAKGLYRDLEREFIRWDIPVSVFKETLVVTARSIGKDESGHELQLEKIQRKLGCKR